MIVVDTSGLLSFVDEDQRFHQEVRRVLEADPGPFLLSPFVLAEVDHLLGERLGVAADLLFLGDVARGAYQLEQFSPDDVAQASEIIGRYRDLRLGLADASLLVLAARAGTNRLLTLDERHFRAVRPLRGRAFSLLPSDA